MTGNVMTDTVRCECPQAFRPCLTSGALVSRSTSRAARALLAGSVAALALTPSAMASPSPIVTTTTSVDYRCKWPLLGVQPLKADWTVRAPQVVDSGELVEYSAQLSSGGNTVNGLAAIAPELSLSGDASAQLALHQPSGAVRTQSVDLDLAPVYSVPKPPAASVDVTARPTSAPLVFDESGPGQIKSAALRLNLMVARPVVGGVVRLTPLTSDLDGNPVSDSDGDPNTFDVYCKPDPSPAKIADVQLGAPYVDAPPAAPGKPAVVLPGRTAVRLDWDGVTHSSGPVVYDLYRDGVRIATAGQYPSTIASRLTPGETYAFQVRAKSPDGKESELSEPVSVTMSAAQNPVLAPFACSLPAGNAFAATLGVERLGTTIHPAGQPVTQGPRRLALFFEGYPTAPSPWPDLGAATIEPAGPQPGGNSLGLLFNWADEASNQRLTAPVTLPAEPQAVARGQRSVVVQSTTAFSVDTSVSGTFYFSWDGDLKQTLIARDASGEALQLDGPGGGPDGNPDTFILDCQYASTIPEPGEIDSVELVQGPPPPASFSYALKGSTTLKTLTKGTLGLTGAIDAQLTLATGAFTADLALNDTSGRLVAAGFLPVTAKVGFVPSGKTTGSLRDGVLTSNSKVRIKVKKVKLFGAIPLAGGNNCQTKNLSDVTLKSTQPEFKPLEGGPLAGTYKISDLNGCGALNGLVSPLTAGGGNTINLMLTPKA